MNRVVAIVSLVFGFGLQNFSFAGALEMNQFFRASEGQWEGRGVRRVLQNDGTYATTRFTVEAEVLFQREKNWNVRTELTTDANVVENSSGSFEIRGEQLFAGTYSPMEPVSVSESSADRLTFQFKRFTLFPSRVFDFSIGQVLLDHDHLRTHQEVRLNGVVILEEETDYQRD